MIYVILATLVVGAAYIRARSVTKKIDPGAHAER